MLLLELSNLITKTTEKALLKSNSEEMKLDLSKIAELITKCEQELTELESKSDSSHQEYEQELLVLSKKHARLEHLINRNIRNRDLLFPNGNVSQPNLTHSTENLDPSQTLQLHEKMVGEQDEQLLLLSKVVGRQKAIGTMISNELDSQVDLLQQVEDGTNETRLNIGRNNNRLDGLVEQETRSGGIM